MEKVIDFINVNRDRYLDELKALLAIPSISALPQHAADVQPVDPLELWQSPPFEATIRDGEIYARGSADDKGQVFMHFKAVEAHLKQNGRLPVNIKFILEGEEEVGSEHLDDFVRSHKRELG